MSQDSREKFGGVKSQMRGGGGGGVPVVKMILLISRLPRGGGRVPW